ncbi:MAG: M42 family peptidase [Clostridiales bacterium]|jgi:endoglucanase|nr:M42 family peptidase [Clostridiales bacterium]
MEYNFEQNNKHLDAYDLQLLQQLCEFNAPSGNESTLANFIADKCREAGADVSIDVLGNVIAHKPATFAEAIAQKIMLCAHMDEVGFIIKSIDNEGFLSFKCVGGIDNSILPSKRVIVHGKNNMPINGVITTIPKHMLKDGKKVTEKTLKIDIGAKDKSDAESMVEKGDYATFNSQFKIVNNRIKSKALDDRIGCFVLLKLLQNNYNKDIFFVWNVQEEVGCRGAKASSFTICPNLALVLEGTTCADFPEVKDEDVSTVLGDGVALTFMDSGCINPRYLVNSLVEIARRNNIKTQFKRGVTGGNDSATIHTNVGGIPTAALSVPCRNIHAPNSIAMLEDITSMYNLTDKFLQEI